MSGLDPAIADGLVRYLGRRERERQERLARARAGLTEREAALVREAAVLGFVHGERYGHAHPRRFGDEDQDFPTDVSIVDGVLTAAAYSFSDLYPTLAGLGR